MTATDQDERKDETQKVSARTSGPEGAAVNVEQVQQPDKAKESLHTPLEQAAEKQKEQAREKERRIIEKQKKAAKKPVTKKKKPIIDAPRVFGYKIPPKAAQKPEVLAKLKKRANPRTGLGSLYIFLDRLFRMKRA